MHGDDVQAVLSKTHNFDCILLDLNLPGVSGLEILKTLCAWDQTTPVIVVTANNFVDVRMQCMQAGATEFLAKPVEATVLNEYINACLAE